MAVWRVRRKRLLEGHLLLRYRDVALPASSFLIFRNDANAHRNDRMQKQCSGATPSVSVTFHPHVELIPPPSSTAKSFFLEEDKVPFTTTACSFSIPSLVVGSGPPFNPLFLPPGAHIPRCITGLKFGCLAEG